MNLPDIQGPESKSKTFLKLKDRESVRGVFIGGFHTFYSKWIGGKSVTTDNKDPEGRVRFRCCFVTTGDGGELVVKIWEFGWAAFEALKGINEIYPLETTKVQITRSGIGTDTTYQILPLVDPKNILTKAQADAINNMALLPLEKKESKLSETQVFDASDEIPF